VEGPGWRLPSTRSAAMVRRHWEAQLLSTDDAVSLIASACAADDAGGPTMTALSSMAIPCRNVRHWARSSAALPPLRPARVTATLASRIAACMAVIVSASSVGSRLPVSARSSANRVAATFSRTSASPSGEVATTSRACSTTRLAG
jgi:hypothetical protein